MIAFVIPVKHPENCNYAEIWRLLNNTIRSVCNSRDDRFHIFVGANKKLPLDDDIDHEKVTILEMGTDPISHPQPYIAPLEETSLSHWQAITREHNVDKAKKRLLTVEAALEMDPKYFFMMDADDLISNRLVGDLMKRQKRVVISNRGYILNTQTGKMVPNDDLNLHCGSTVAVKASYVKSNMNDFEWAVSWLGRHQVHKLFNPARIPFRSTMWCLHDDNYSVNFGHQSKLRAGKIKLDWRKPPEKVRKEFMVAG